MSEIQEILAEYARMRKNGLEAKAALQTLRLFIAGLDETQRQELANLVRAWEAGEIQTADDPRPPTTEPPAKPPSPIKPLQPRTSSLIRSITPPGSAQSPPTEDVTWVNCPHCGKTNQSHEVFCYACGQLLEPERGRSDTRNFTQPVEAFIADDYFGPESVLALEVRGMNHVFQVRPQHAGHEIVIGRSTSGSVMIPDVDLANYHGANLGVSRLHLSIRYDAGHNTISVVDLGSANGTFINGQRLHPQEVRVLRNGDELRLGRLVLKVTFRHPAR